MTENDVYVPTTDEEKPSLNQLAIVLGIPAVRLQSAQVAYKPINGEPYEAKKINWSSVSSFIARRLDKTGYDSVEAVYAAALATEYTPKRATHTSAEGSVWGKILVGTTPVRKGDLKVGDKIMNKATNAIFNVVFVTPTIVCYEPDHANDETVVTLSIGNRMFNNKYSIVDNTSNADAE